MGRALAHELGHYLLASKAHTERGLMKAIMTASELFMPDARAFRLEPAQRRSVAARLRGEPLVASR
jgi:Zn-dependent peptidase ImmA (M78 family)